MKAVFESDDEQEIKRIAKSTDMALFIFHLVCNSRIEDEGTIQLINQLMNEYSIDIDDLIS